MKVILLEQNVLSSVFPTQALKEENVLNCLPKNKKKKTEQRILSIVPTANHIPHFN